MKGDGCCDDPQTQNAPHPRGVKLGLSGRLGAVGVLVRDVRDFSATYAQIIQFTIAEAIQLVYDVCIGLARLNGGFQIFHSFADVGSDELAQTGGLDCMCHSKYLSEERAVSPSVDLISSPCLIDRPTGQR